ncbi:unnamed protein product [Staurois parvus]|uniref:Uncharacterized protein n=1 Tax=Staurois parvus TaxID=386267 RepID=A0ABN9BSL5_9NEOB|nr:unnamed protein product [Staurois parvus]
MEYLIVSKFHGLIAQVVTYHSITLEFTELCVTHFFTNVCRSSLHSWVLDIIHLWPWR